MHTMPCLNEPFSELTRSPLCEDAPCERLARIMILFERLSLSKVRTEPHLLALWSICQKLQGLTPAASLWQPCGLTQMHLDQLALLTDDFRPPAEASQDWHALYRELGQLRDCLSQESALKRLAPRAD